MNPKSIHAYKHRFLFHTAIVLLVFILTTATAIPVFSASTNLQPALSLSPDNVTLITSSYMKYPVYHWTSWDASTLMSTGDSSADLAEQTKALEKWFDSITEIKIGNVTLVKQTSYAGYSLNGDMIGWFSNSRKVYRQDPFKYLQISAGSLSGDIQITTPEASILIANTAYPNKTSGPLLQSAGSVKIGNNATLSITATGSQTEASIIDWKENILDVYINDTLAADDEYSVSGSSITIQSTAFPSTGTYSIIVTSQGYENVLAWQTITSASKGGGSTTTSQQTGVTVNEHGKQADVTVSDDAFNRGSKGDAIIIQPNVSNNVTSVNVSMPASSLSHAAQQNNDVSVKTEIAVVTLTSALMTELTENEIDKVKLQIETQDDSSVKITLKKDNKTVESVDSGIKISLSVNSNAWKTYDSSTVLAIVNPDGSKTILPNSSFVDGKMKGLLNGSSTVMVVQNEQAFADIETHWGRDSILFVSSRGLFSGTGNGNFNPNIPMSRGMLATVMTRYAGALNASEMVYDTLSEQIFEDVTPDTYYFKPIHWINEKRIMVGTGKDFQPNLPLTREQLASVFYNYANAYHITLPTLENAVSLESFHDSDSISSWAQTPMEWAVSTGLLRGKASQKLSPQDNATRAEVAAVFKQFIEAVIQ